MKRRPTPATVKDDDDLRRDVAILRERRGGVSRPLTLTELRRRQRGQRQH